MGLFAKVSASLGRATNSSPLGAPKVAAGVGHAVGAVSLPRGVDLPWSMDRTALAGQLTALNGGELKLPWLKPRIVTPSS